MKGLRVYLEQRGWNIISYKSNTSFLEAEYKNRYKLVVEKRLGNNRLYRTKWVINSEEYFIQSNGDNKFIFEELEKIGFK